MERWNGEHSRPNRESICSWSPRLVDRQNRWQDGRAYPRCVLICPEPSTDGTHGQVVYRLPDERPDLTFEANIGVDEMAGGHGRAISKVQGTDSGDSVWETFYASPTMPGGVEPVSGPVELDSATYLRLHTTDAGDDITSDHTVWSNARLK